MKCSQLTLSDEMPVEGSRLMYNKLFSNIHYLSENRERPIRKRIVAALTSTHATENIKYKKQTLRDEK